MPPGEHTWEKGTFRGEGTPEKEYIWGKSPLEERYTWGKSVLSIASGAEMCLASSRVREGVHEVNENQGKSRAQMGRAWHTHHQFLIHLVTIGFYCQLCLRPLVDSEELHGEENPVSGVRL